MALIEPFKLREHMEKRLGGLKAARQPYEAHWRDIADVACPRRGKFLHTQQEKGEARNSKIYDSTAIDAGKTTGNGMSSGLTPASRPWFRTTTSDPELREFASVKGYLKATEDAIKKLLHDSGFYSVSRQGYLEMAHFGLAVGMLYEDFDHGAAAHHYTIGEYWIGCGADGRPNTLYLRCDMSVAQMVERFHGNVSDTVRRLYDQSRYDDKVEVYHAIEPNWEREPGKIDRTNMAWRSVFWEAKADKQKNALLSFSGFREQPFWAARWETTGADVYANSPGMDALPHAQSLQHMAKRKAQAVDFAVKPALKMKGSGFNEEVEAVPGGINCGDDIDGAGPLWQVDIVGVQHMRADIAEEQQAVRSHYHADLFRMISDSARANRTAREIDGIYEEQMMQVGPVVERAQVEMLRVAVERAYGVVERAGLLPPPPEELEGRDLDIEFVSILAQAQKMVSAGAIERTLAFAGNIAAVDPGALDKIDFDQAIDEYADIMGPPPSIIRSDEEVAKRRAAREQQQQAQAAAAAMPAMKDAAASAELLSRTDAAPGSALGALLGLRGR